MDEFRNGTVPEWEMGLVRILGGLGGGGVLYWELVYCDRDGL